jgi:hypothetical protein
MSQINPPSLPAWMLERFTPEGANDALAGDLLEEFRMGRSRLWFWRQVLAALAIAWLKSLRGHRALVVFAVLWSMLAPAWVTWIAKIENEANLNGPIARMNWPLSALSTFAIWMVLNLIFIWAGMLFYLIPHTWITRKFSTRQLWRGFLITASMFNTVYVGVFILMDLISSRNTGIDRHTATHLGEITDLRMWAVALRVPYFLTMLCALWGATTRSENGPQGLAALTPPASPGDASDPAPPNRTPPFDSAPFPPRQVIAGCVAAVIVESLLCSVSIDRVVSAIGILPAAIVYIVEAVFAGACAAVLVGAPSGERSWNRFLAVALICGPAWVWVPPAVLLSNRNSVWALPAAAAGAAILAICLRQIAQAHAGGALENYPLAPPEERELFAESLQTVPSDWHAFVIAICCYAAFIALRASEFELACIFAAASAFIFASQWASASQNPSPTMNPRARGARRLIRAVLPALLVTILLLVAATRHNDASGDSGTNAGTRDAKGETSAQQKDRQAAQGAGVGFDGYQSIVLWPNPPKKEIVVPIQEKTPVQADRTEKRVVIRFDGSYWYFQPPATRPGPRAHVANGNPLDVNIHSENFMPLMMEANQNLATAIRTSRCREVQVAIENRDNWPGRIAIGVVLTDSASAGKPTLYLGQRPVVSSLPDHFTQKTAPVEETLRFPLPSRPAMRRFDEITLIVVTEVGHTETGARIAVQQLEFLPR